LEKGYATKSGPESLDSILCCWFIYAVCVRTIVVVLQVVFTYTSLLEDIYSGALIDEIAF